MQIPGNGKRIVKGRQENRYESSTEGEKNELRHEVRMKLAGMEIYD